MYDLKWCVRSGGKVYCWDEASERIVTVIINDIELGECPDNVMKLIMRCMGNGGKNKEGG